jgi:hypothetical protein
MPPGDLAKKVNRMVEQIFVNDMKLAEDELLWRNKKVGARWSR